MSDEEITGVGVSSDDRFDGDDHRVRPPEFDTHIKADRERMERYGAALRRFVPKFVVLSGSDLRNRKKVLAAGTFLLLLVGAPALALHRAPAPAAALRSAFRKCAQPKEATTPALIELDRFRRSETPSPNIHTGLRTLLTQALADKTHPSLWRHKSTLNELRLQCGWADNPREVHESIVLQLSAHTVPLDYDTAGPLHALASEIAKSPSAIASVTDDGRVTLPRVFAWLSTVDGSSAAGKTLEPNRAYFTRLETALKTAGELHP